MKVSIVMPYYNAADYIHETVDAIIAQTYKDWELIIVDDCSSALETEEVLQAVGEKDTRIKVLRAERNGGAGLARNIAIKEAQGSYLAFCDADDWWYPTKLEEQLKWMEEKGYDMTCTWYEDADDKLESYYTMKQKPKNTYNSMVLGCNIGTPGVVINIEKLGKKYMPNLRRAEDWGLWMEYLRNTEMYTYPKALWKYRHVSGSETSNKLKQIQAVVAMYRKVLDFNVVKAWLVCVCFFLPMNVLKKLRKM